MEVIRQLTIRATAQGVEQAEAGLRRLADAQAKVGEAAGGASVEVSRAERSIQSAGSQFDRLLRSIDPVTRAMAQYEAGVRVVSRAEAAGKASAEDAARAKDLLEKKLLSVTAAAQSASAALIETSRAAAAAENAQRNYDHTSGVSRPAASSNGATFSELDLLAKRLDEIDRARAAAFADSSQLYYNEKLGVDLVTKSARDAASAFMQMSDAVEEASAATARANAAAASSRLNLGGVTLGGAGGVAGFGRLGAFSAVQAEATGAAKAVGLASHEVQNLNYQLSDIMVQLAAGQNPFLILAQQGGQIAPIFTSAATKASGFGGAVAAVGGALGALFTPLNLVMIGLTALAATSASLFSGWEDAEDAALSYADAMEELNRILPTTTGEQEAQAAALAEVTKKYEDGARAALKYALAQAQALEAQLSTAPTIGGFGESGILADVATAEAQQRLDAVSAAVAKLQEQLRSFGDRVAEGRTEQLNEAIRNTSRSSGEASESVGRLGASFDVAARNAISMGQALYVSVIAPQERLREVLLENERLLAKERLADKGAGYEHLSEIYQRQSAGLPLSGDTSQADDSLRTIRAAAEALQVEQDALRMGTAAAAAYRKEHELLAGIRAQGREATEVEAAAIRELAAAYGQQAAAVEQRRSVEQQSKAYLDVVTSAKQRLEQMQLEQQMLGMSADAVARLRIEQELLNKVTSAGVMLSPQQRQELSGLAAQMAEAEVQTKAMKEASDLLGQGLEAAFSGSSDAIKRFLLDLAKAALQALLFGQGPLANLMAVVTRGATEGASGATGAATPASTAAAAVQAAAVALPTARPTATAAAAVANDNGANLLPFLGAGKAASHITGLSDPFEAALSRMLAEAPASVRGAVTINSGFRSVERQTELFNAAVAKYGSVAAARRWVAPPGRSQHNFGNAADLGFQSGEAREWFHANAGRYGLEFPMGHEPWHIQGTKGLGGGGAADAVQRLAEASDKASSGLGTFGKSIDEVITGTSLTGGQGGSAPPVAGLLARGSGTGGGTPAAQAAANVEQGFLAQLGQGFESIIAGLGQIGQGFLGGFGNVLQSLISGLSGGGGGGGGIGGLLSGIIGGLFGGGGGSSGSVPIPTPNPMGRFAEGGISDRPAIFGEAGPEAAVPLKHGRIPVEMRMPAGGGGSVHIRSGDIIINGNPDAVTIDLLERRLRQSESRTLGAVNRAQAAQWRTG
jgi:hypothetical protein